MIIPGWRRRQLALAMPEGVRHYRDPRTAIKRAVGTPERRLHFWTQLTVELDNPAVWRFEAWFSRGEDEIEVGSWEEWMAEMVVAELDDLIPKEAQEQKLWRAVLGASLVYRAPVSEADMVVALSDLAEVQA